MPKYSIDTSAILDAWARHYPNDLFPSFWEKFKTHILRNDCIAIELVAKELQQKDDGCYDWFRTNDLINFFVEIDDDVQNGVSQIFEEPRYMHLVNGKSLYAADPFVISLAKSRTLIVISGEKRMDNINKPKIPNVCEDLGIPCMSLIDFMRHEKWTL